jgi:STE24 endopeptidase
MNYFIAAFAGLLAARLVAQLVLASLNRREVLRHRHQIPPAFAGVMDEETYRRSVDYTLEKNRFGMLEAGFEALLLAAVVLSGALPWLHQLFLGWFGAAAWAGALFVMTSVFLIGLPSLPLDWWEQFRLEERFGFNRSTPRLWLIDKAKGTAIGFLLGFPLLLLLLKLVDWLGSGWWLWGFGVFMVFQLLMVALYPMLIMPLFNKFEPLPEGELRERLVNLSERAGFKNRGIQVMDGSRRSAHSNAFFTGFGRFRRIVLFDTLIEQLKPEELEAVLAHEIGHYKRGHIPRMLGISTLLAFGAFWALAKLAESPRFLDAFGFGEPSMAAAFLLFMLLAGLVTFWLAPAFNLLSRIHEFEADAFARAAMGRAEPLVGALRKLSEKNLSNLTPHPVFSGFYYSHPTLHEREVALRSAP